LAGQETRVPIVTTWVNGDGGTCVEFAPSIALLLVQYAEKLNQEAALLGVRGHGFAGDFLQFGDVDLALVGWAIAVLTYDEAKDVNEEDDALCKCRQVILRLCK
jgi:hypothetical protein